MDEWEKFLRFNLDTIRFNLDTNVESIIRSSLDDAQSVLHQVIHDPQTIKVMNQTTQMICEVFRDRGRIFTCGNGGSMCDAMHFAEEWTGRFRADRQPLPAMALSDPAHLTCVANDFGFDEVFARSITAFGRPGDLLIAISTSGNSQNVVRAIEAAKSADMKTFALLGKDGGKMKTMADFWLVAPGQTSDRIQEIHIMVLHILIEAAERIIFPENY